MRVACPIALTALGCIGAGSCASHASRLAATPLSAGKREIGLGLDLISFDRGSDRAVLPSPEVSLRRGVGSGCDIGGRFSLIHGELGARCAVASDGDAALALAPALAIGFQPATNNATDLLYARGSLRLIAELRGSERVAWLVSFNPSIVAAGPATIFRGELGESRFLFQPGLSVGAALAREFGPRTLVEIGLVPSVASSGEAPRPQLHGGVGLTW